MNELTEQLYQIQYKLYYAYFHGNQSNEFYPSDIKTMEQVAICLMDVVNEYNKAKQNETAN